MKCFNYKEFGQWSIECQQPIKRKLKDSKRNDANVANTTKDSSFDEEVCAFFAQSHFDLNCALHLEHPNAVRSYNASKIERNWFSVAHATHTMSFVTISHAKIIELDATTWYAYL
jgi:hypothetical protein